MYLVQWGLRKEFCQASQKCTEQTRGELINSNDDDELYSTTKVAPRFIPKGSPHKMPSFFPSMGSVAALYSVMKKRQIGLGAFSDDERCAS